MIGLKATDSAYTMQFQEPVLTISDLDAGMDGRMHGRMLSEIRSDVADHGSIISDRDDAQKTGLVGCLPYGIVPDFLPTIVGGALARSLLGSISPSL